MPALGLYPWPEDDTKSRLGVMMLAHVVFGVSLAEVEPRLAHRRVIRWLVSRLVTPSRT
jgi:hypothetical protein